MKLSGTIPTDLALWVQQKIDSGEFYNTSHILQKAIAQLKQNSEGQPSATRAAPAYDGVGKKAKAP